MVVRVIVWCGLPSVCVYCVSIYVRVCVCTYVCLVGISVSMAIWVYLKLTIKCAKILRMRKKNQDCVREYVLILCAGNIHRTNRVPIGAR